MARYTYGGQALIEGVLMRGRDAIAVAFRSPEGSIVWQTERARRRLPRQPLGELPFVRGLVVLYETLVVGTRWLVRSRSLAASEEGVELGPRRDRPHARASPWRPAIGVFFLLPLFIATRRPRASIDNGLVQHLVEGLIRVAIFLGYLLLDRPGEGRPARLPVPRRRAHDDPRAGGTATR